MSEMLRVLQVEDSASDADLIVRLLEKSGYLVQSERVEQAESMRRALARQDWDIIIADYQLPGFNATEAVRIRDECAQDLPLIVVSGVIGQDRGVEMIRAGAQDCVLKDRIAILAPAVQREIRDARSRRQRRQVEDRLRDRDEWLALAVGAAHLGMFDFYPQSGKLVFSEAAHRHFGLPSDVTVSYEMFARGVHPDDRGRVVDLVRWALDPESGGEYAAHYRAIGLTDQVERWVTVQGRVFFDSEAKPIRFVGVTMDMTQRKHLEEQVRQTQKLESVGMLAAGVAHDFNNLLTVITGFSQMTLENLPAHDPLRAGLQEVINAAARGADLTGQLLAFSRRQPSRPQTILLNEVVTKIQEMLRRLIGSNMSLAVSLDPATGAICADAGHIDQVIMNLVVNARDAMPNGGGLVIETASHLLEESLAASNLELPPGRYATVAVSDTGTGMSAEVKAKIFDPFFTTKQPGKGTGLGLSTVYGIVRQYGGSISVSSELGRGTKFTIFLPAVDRECDEAAAVSMREVTTKVVFAQDGAVDSGFVRASAQV
jgi:two-component system, cell cycle sensor histidine kinase and response regulator CckA